MYTLGRLLLVVGIAVGAVGVVMMVCDEAVDDEVGGETDSSALGFGPGVAVVS